MHAQCAKCQSSCCKYFCFELDAPVDYDDFETMRWFLCHEDVTIHIDEDDWFIEIANTCKMIVDGGGCAIYDDRPLICREHTPDECEMIGGDFGYEELFKTPEQIDKYARKTLGKKEYEKQKKKYRKKSDKENEKGKKKALPIKGKKKNKKKDVKKGKKKLR